MNSLRSQINHVDSGAVAAQLKSVFGRLADERNIGAVLIGEAIAVNSSLSLGVDDFLLFTSIDLVRSWLVERDFHFEWLAAAIVAADDCCKFDRSQDFAADGNKALISGKIEMTLVGSLIEVYVFDLTEVTIFARNEAAAALLPDVF